jgi:hypothetical protein
MTPEELAIKTLEKQAADTPPEGDDEEEVVLQVKDPYKQRLLSRVLGGAALGAAGIGGVYGISKLLGASANGGVVGDNPPPPRLSPDEIAKDPKMLQLFKKMTASNAAAEGAGGDVWRSVLYPAGALSLWERLGVRGLKSWAHVKAEQPAKEVKGLLSRFLSPVRGSRWEAVDMRLRGAESDAITRTAVRRWAARAGVNLGKGNAIDRLFDYMGNREGVLGSLDHLRKTNPKNLKAIAKLEMELGSLPAPVIRGRALAGDLVSRTIAESIPADLTKRLGGAKFVDKLIPNLMKLFRGGQTPEYVAKVLSRAHGITITPQDVSAIYNTARSTTSALPRMISGGAAGVKLGDPLFSEKGLSSLVAPVDQRFLTANKVLRVAPGIAAAGVGALNVAGVIGRMSQAAKDTAAYNAAALAAGIKRESGK